MQEGYSQRQIARQGHTNQTKMKRIKTFWLAQRPPEVYLASCVQYLVFDGTYFSHEYCLLIFWNPRDHTILTTHFCKKESYAICLPWFLRLKQQGLSPKSITMDGNTQVMRAIQEVWPACIIQRCLYHIQRQGLMWLRRFPKTSLAQKLKYILHLLPLIQTPQQQKQWWLHYTQWHQRFHKEISALCAQDKVESDVIRAYRMIDHAQKDMFHFLDDVNIPSTSNGAESYFSWLKHHYCQHRGLRKAHLENYLLWYVYLNRPK